MSAYKWQFAPRFRRNAFGWRSDTPIQRIKEALTEIRLVARKEPIQASEGAIVLLEKLSPALMNVDSSSGALGSAVTRAARDFAVKRPEFAIAAGLAALHWMARGHGYDLTGLDVHAAYDAVMQAALGAGIEDQQIKAQVRQMIDVQPSAVNFVQKILQVQLNR